MAISPLAATSALSTASTRDRSAKQSESAQKPEDSGQLTAAELRNQRAKQHNLDILKANQSASLSVAGQPLSLLYQTAIDAINAELAPIMGDKAIERAQQDNVDVSPQATAERIVSSTVGNFARYQEIHADLPEPEQVDRFLDLISTGIDNGFSAARDILDGLSVLEGSIADNIDKTYELVQKGLEQFRQQFTVNTADVEVGSDNASSDS